MNDDDIEHLLTDSYMEFTERIGEIHKELKVLTAEFKAKYDKYNNEKDKLYIRARKELQKYKAAKVEVTSNEV